MNAMTRAFAMEPARDSRPAPRHLSLWDLLVWTYRQQKAHWHLKDEAHWFAWMVDRTAGADGFGRTPAVHVDAAMVHACVLELGEIVAPLIVQCAAADEVPERSATQPMPFPTRADKAADEQWGRAVIDGIRVDYRIKVAERVADKVPVYDFRGRGRRVIVGHELQTVEVLYCPIDWHPDPNYAAAVNAIHDAWVAAMDNLAGRIGAVPLQDHVVSQPRKMAA